MMTTASSSHLFPDCQLPASEQVEEEPPAFEYALQNDLTVDSQIDPYSILAVFSESLLDLTTEVDPDGVSSDAHLPVLYIPVVSSPTMQLESLTTTESSVTLLDEVRRRERDQDMVPNWPSQKPLSGRWKWALEPPLLPGDESIDSRKLMKTVRQARLARLDTIRLPRETFNLPKEEDMSFPKSSHKFRRDFTVGLHNEKLDISRDSLRLLGQVLCDDWNDGIYQELLKDLDGRRPFRKMSITPPLIPNDLPEEPFIPSSKVCKVAIASDLPSLLTEDAEAVEAQLLQYEDKMDEFCYSPLEDRSTPKLSPLQATVQLGSKHLGNYLRVDEPILPRSPEILPLAAMDGLVDVSDTMRLDKPSRDSDVVYEGTSEEIFSDGLLEILQESVEMADRGLAQERLSATDPLSRVEIPTMDFSIAPPTWQTIPTTAMCQFSFIWDTFSKDYMPSWRTTRYDVPERQLNWIPFPPSMACRQIEETIDDEKRVEGFLSDISHGVATSADYVWKKPGVSILLDTYDLEDELEELEPVTIPGDKLDANTDQTVEKHKRSHSEVGSPTKDKSPRESSGVVEMSSAYECPTRLEKSATESRLLLGDDDATNTTTLLTNFIDFRTSKRQKLTKSSFFPAKTKESLKREESAGNHVSPIVVAPEINNPTDSLFKQTVPRALFPNPEISTTPTKIIKALTLSRGIFSRLEKLYPAEIIERDFDRWNTTVWSPGSVTRSVDISPLAIEADIIISPATGIVLTTLIKAIQKPVQGSFLTPLRERIAHIARRYEHLVVLVSEAAPPSNKATMTTREGSDEPYTSTEQETSREFTTSESTALAEFYGFVAGVGAHAYYVSGGEATLARWVVGIATKHSGEAQAVSNLLIQDETQWEVFLRRAGLNAYAAQAILGLMKGQYTAPGVEGGMMKPEGHELGEFGLAAFVRMMPEERLRRFSGLLGGAEVLNRVNTVLEWKWA